ncbi:hypothetical protein [Kangiella koreensis]|uniref:Uncharacterized protein n=1 Tax=Kangiella koreensis (strain DSM 16069 / JCM 12317 / KCTC 12182 / SW-125) TaxID=523791 RepID=C7R834_KANKD|nr:hypothetical protein [Kangiella koreensis]ACV25816.1 conserved hypothetical protein [Kangiella koreensis DSM 16069]
MEQLKHSGLGITTFVLGLIAPIGLIITIIMAAVAEASSYGGMDPSSSEAMVIGLFLILFVILALIAVGIGIGALVQKGYKKIFPILGVVFSSVVLVITIALMVIGANAGY